MRAKVLISGQGAPIRERVRKIFERESCEYRHENGNCLKVGGFCLAVDDRHCPKKKQNQNPERVNYGDRRMD